MSDTSSLKIQTPESVNDHDLENLLAQVDNVVFKKHITQLSNFPTLKNETNLERCMQSSRMNRIQKIVYDRKENNLQKLYSVLSTMSLHGATMFILLQGTTHETQIYIGTYNTREQNEAAASFETLERSLEGNFPGMQSEVCYTDELRKISQNINSPSIRHISCISGVPALKEHDGEGFIQGVEKVIDGMKGKEYTALLLAEPVNQEELARTETAYQQLYSALSFMESQQLTVSMNQSLSLGQSLAQGISQTITHSVGNTQTKSSSVSNSTGKTESSTESVNFSGGLLGAALGSFFEPIGPVIGGLIGNSLTASTSNTSSTSHTHTKTKGESQSHTVTDSRASGSSRTETQSITGSTGTGESWQYTYKNRQIADVLAVIDEQLKRIRACKNHGMWQWATYFLSQEKRATQMGAQIFSGILSGESTGIERRAILHWSAQEEKRSFGDICQSLSKFSHPVFDTSERYIFNTLTPTSLISTQELAIGMNLPQKSLPGIPVFNSVEFGRSVTTHDVKTEKNTVDIGAINHMGRIEKEQRMALDIDSLTAHAFVTGSTGSGKSHTIHSLLYNLWKKKNIPFLVIEPAKGEYKDVFGGFRGLKIFGTNPEFTPVLQINPFSFPQGIHITEHIDRMIEILNAVWPMYAAMPAVLKAGVEEAYQRMGWSLLSSYNPNGRIFPDFYDLLEVLPGIIEKSAYSAEVKGNYTGSLVTRIESLTNGYYRTLFQKEEIDTNWLFNRPCIIDLSRIGSSETKALVMGVIFMKLQEHRMTDSIPDNAKLKHITVMEEAHTLMRRSAYDQSNESANLQGKAVEMIANAIAEMRSYGQGFIIADQAPGLLDQSVIRNTNTKIILRLPDWEDRQLVGRAANLNEEQIQELAKLRTGCAAVYQNNWQEAVLCQFDPFEKSNKRPFVLNKKNLPVDLRMLSRTQLVLFYLGQIKSEGREQLDTIRQYYPEFVQKIENQGNLDFEDFKKLISLDELFCYRPTPEERSAKWFYKQFRLVINQLSKETLKESHLILMKDQIMDHLARLDPDQAAWWDIEKRHGDFLPEEFV